MPTGTIAGKARHETERRNPLSAACRVSLPQFTSRGLLSNSSRGISSLSGRRSCWVSGLNHPFGGIDHSGNATSSPIGKRICFLPAGRIAIPVQFHAISSAVAQQPRTSAGISLNSCIARTLQTRADSTRAFMAETTERPVSSLLQEPVNSIS